MKGQGLGTMSKKIKITPQQLFFLLSIMGILSFLIFAFINGNRSTFDWIVMQHKSDYTFADHFYHIYYGSDLSKTYNSYDVDPCFPPLIYLLYHYMYRILPVDHMEKLVDVEFYPYYLFIYMVYASVLIVLFSYAVQAFNQGNKNTFKNMLLTLIAVLSVPFGASALERGNSVFLTLIVLIFALIFKDSENKYLRELALILIAIAANIKLYPAILGLLYLKERRFKEAFRAVIYGVVLFLFPFVFFNGISGIKDYLIIIYLMQGRSIERLTTIRGVITCGFMAIGGEEMKWIGHAVGKVTENIYLLLTLAAFFLCKNKWKSLFLLVSPMVIYVSSAYRYTIIYFFLALLFFLKECDNQENRNRLNYCYAFLFSMIFSIPIWAFKLELENLIYSFVYLMLIIVLIDVTVGYIKTKKSQKILEEK